MTALLRPREDPKQASVMLGVRDTEISERLRRHGNVASRLPRPARRRAHFVSHAYIVPHATDKTRWVGPDRRPDPAPPGLWSAQVPEIADPARRAYLTEIAAEHAPPTRAVTALGQCPRIHWTGWPS